MQEFTLRGTFITLAQAIKVAGLAETGGQAKFRIRSGELSVNGEVELRPGRKLIVGDRFSNGNQEWVVTQ